MIKKFLVAMLCAARSIATAEPVADPEIVRLGDEVHTLAEFQAFVAPRTELLAAATSPAGVRQALAEFIDAQVFRLEGARLKLRPNGVMPDEPGYYMYVQTHLLGQCPEPDDATLKDYLDSHPQRFVTPALVRVSRTMLNAREPIHGQPAAQYAAAQVTQVKTGALKFEDLGADLPVSQATRNEDMRFLTIPQPHLPRNALEQELAEAPQGAVLGPIVAGDAVYVLKVTDRREPVVAEWPQARTMVARVMGNECYQANLEAKRTELYQRFNVQVNEEVVAQIRPFGAPPAP